MKQQFSDLRQALYDHIRSGNRTNRRAILSAYKLVTKACRILGLPNIETQRTKSAAQVVSYPKTHEVQEVPAVEENSVVLAHNAEEDKPGPVKRSRKPKQL